MEIQSARKYIGARQAFERKLRSVGTASYRLHFRGDVGTAHSFFGYFHYIHGGLNLLAHIIVLVLYLDCAAVRELVVDFAREVLEFFLSTLKAVAVVIAYDVGKNSLLHISLHRHKVVEALVTFGMLGSFPSRKHDYKLVGYTHRVDHLVLCVSGMHVSTGKRNFCHGSIEVLILEFANLAAVHSVSPVCAKALHIELVCTSPISSSGLNAIRILPCLISGCCLR